MPELPEVETILRTLRPKLTGRRFAGAQVLLPKVIRAPEPDKFREMIVDKEILGLERRGKYLLCRLSEGLVFVIHLRMTGSLVYCPPDAPPARHTHLILPLDNGDELRFADLRQFGRVWLLPEATLSGLSGYRDLGVEPLEAGFTVNYLKKILKGRHRRIKPLLLDQTLIAGLGNIYADEALHRARLNPERPASSLSAQEIARLHQAVRAVLEEGITYRGTTVRDYLDGEGRPGGYQELLRVYNREGQPCRRCSRAIERKKISGRSAYYCPSCQK